MTAKAFASVVVAAILVAGWNFQPASAGDPCHGGGYSSTSGKCGDGSQPCGPGQCECNVPTGNVDCVDIGKPCDSSSFMMLPDNEGKCGGGGGTAAAAAGPPASPTPTPASPTPTPPRSPTAGTQGDPVVTGFDGCSWLLQGQPGDVRNLLTETNHVVNTQLVLANLTDDYHNNDGTFHGSISVRYRSSVVVASVTPEGNLTVLLQGDEVPFEAVRKVSGVVVKVFQYFPFYGQVAEVTTPGFKVFLHAVQPYTDAAGWNRGHLDVIFTLFESETTWHGLLGQSAHRVGKECPEGWDFHGEGVEDNYAVAELSSWEYKFNLFVDQPASSRRSLLADDDVAFLYHPGKAMVSASVRVL